MEEFLPIKSFRVKNFKGIRDSGDVRFTPLTAFIGNNGSGKSSLIEALQTYQDIVVNGLDKAMNRWRGFENIHNPPISLVGGNGKKYHRSNETIAYSIHGDFENSFLIELIIRLEENGLKIERELFDWGDDNPFLLRQHNGDIQIYGKSFASITPLGYSILSNTQLLANEIKWRNQYPLEAQGFMKVTEYIKNWQFMTLNPFNMIYPLPLQATGGKIVLHPDGSNIAEYLMDIRKQDQDAYEGIIESLTYVLPYLKDMQPNLTTELERTVYLRMHEDDYTIPQWLLSTGTMRILCLLALFRHPTPPPVIFIEEIENGLDPRTIHFVVEEIRNLIESGRSQVVITTHSPYLLDLLDISQIVVVERENGETKFSRPADDEALQIWAKQFGPGSLYTMSKLTRG